MVSVPGGDGRIFIPCQLCWDAASGRSQSCHPMVGWCPGVSPPSLDLSPALGCWDGGVGSCCIEAEVRFVYEVLDTGQDLQASVRCFCMHETGSVVPNLGQ